ncbi:hypothetical protein K3495_g7204 [Podosphaera aphanis]|nr:hypothetical protein K3495_g7204 [Podosphaera aphanis]
MYKVVVRGKVKERERREVYILEPKRANKGKQTANIGLHVTTRALALTISDIVKYLVKLKFENMVSPKGARTRALGPLSPPVPVRSRVPHGWPTSPHPISSIDGTVDDAGSGRASANGPRSACHPAHISVGTRLTPPWRRFVRERSDDGASDSKRDDSLTSVLTMIKGSRRIGGRELVMTTLPRHPRTTFFLERWKEAEQALPR